jgi:hypothetical protein
MILKTSNYHCAWTPEKDKSNKITIKRCSWHKKYHGKSKIISVEYEGHPDGCDDPKKDICEDNTEIIVSDGCCPECVRKTLEKSKI